MHPLRFPNSGIRAKVFMRKIGFKLHVMRLNHVESFYAFLMHFRSEGSRCKGQPGLATASPLAGATGHLQGGARPPATGGPPAVAVDPRARTAAARPQGPAAHGATARGSCLRPSRRWRLPAARPQGAASLPGLPLSGAAANRGSAHARRRRQPARCHPKAATPACRRGGCPRRRRAAPPPAQGSGDGGGADGGKERARASF
ncbi:hypothetical protein GW17_00050374 [Ensete ventricosum]|nr:hypothetical protein GW17_00050374 [Ensete ventricosum]